MITDEKPATAEPFRFILVTLSLWKWAGAIAVGGSSEDLKAFAKTQDIDIDANGATEVGRAYVEIGKPWLLWVESLENIPALAHEALHVASGVLEARGLKHTPESEEAYTYTMESIIRTALTATEWETACPA